MAYLFTQRSQDVKINQCFLLIIWLYIVNLGISEANEVVPVASSPLEHNKYNILEAIQN